MLHPLIANPSATRHILKKFKLRAVKGLGQNFLIDSDIVRRIVDAADIKSGDEVLEIGPGIGTLTQGLLEAGAHVTALLGFTLANRKPSRRTRGTTTPPTPSATTRRGATPRAGRKPTALGLIKKQLPRSRSRSADSRRLPRSAAASLPSTRTSSRTVSPTCKSPSQRATTSSTFRAARR